MSRLGLAALPGAEAGLMARKKSKAPTARFSARRAALPASRRRAAAKKVAVKRAGANKTAAKKLVTPTTGAATHGATWLGWRGRSAAAVSAQGRGS